MLATLDEPVSSTALDDPLHTRHDSQKLARNSTKARFPRQRLNATEVIEMALRDGVPLHVVEEYFDFQELQRARQAQ